MARLAVDVRSMIGDDVERREHGPRARGFRGEIVVEELLPRRGVQPGRAGDHAVEIEQERVEARQGEAHGVARAHGTASPGTARIMSLSWRLNPPYDTVAGLARRGPRRSDGTLQ
jgi:hypothetical protein